MKVLIIEHEDGRIGLEKPNHIEWESKNTSEEVFLNNLESLRKSERKITHGIIEESDIPVGGNINDLIWDGRQLSYGDKYKKQELRTRRNSLLEKTDLACLIAIETNSDSLIAIKEYRQTLRDLGNIIDNNPDNVVFPIDPSR